MADTKPMKIHMHSSTQLDKDEKGKIVDQMIYLGMINSFLYLTFIRPNITHNVHLCARFQSYLEESRLKIVKMIF